MACNCNVEVTDASQKKLLMVLLSINLVFFIFELGIGWYAESIGLIADSLDMLADTLIYSIAIYAIGRASSIKANAALLSGYFQLMLAILIGLEILRRFFYGSEPISTLMIIMGILALIANGYCLKLIHKHRNGEVHMRASWVFSANDVLANIGVIFSGVLVFWLDSRWPDLIIGAVITLVLLFGAFYIIKDAKTELKFIEDNSCKNNINDKS